MFHVTRLDPKPTVTSVGFAASNSQALRPIVGDGRVYGNDDLIGNMRRKRGCPLQLTQDYKGCIASKQGHDSARQLPVRSGYIG